MPVCHGKRCAMTAIRYSDKVVRVTHRKLLKSILDPLLGDLVIQQSARIIKPKHVPESFLKGERVSFPVF